MPSFRPWRRVRTQAWEALVLSWGDLSSRPCHPEAVQGHGHSPHPGASTWPWPRPGPVPEILLCREGLAPCKEDPPLSSVPSPLPPSLPGPLTPPLPLQPLTFSPHPNPQLALQLAEKWGPWEEDCRGSSASGVGCSPQEKRPGSRPKRPAASLRLGDAAPAASRPALLLHQRPVCELEHGPVLKTTPAHLPPRLLSVPWQ